MTEEKKEFIKKIFRMAKDKANVRRTLKEAGLPNTEEGMVAWADQQEKKNNA